MSGIDQYTKLLFHCEDKADSSLFVHNTAPNAGVYVQNDGKFDKCLEILGSEGIFEIPFYSDLLLGNQDFTIDFWCKNFPPGANYDGFSFFRQGLSAIWFFNYKGFYLGARPSGSSLPSLTLSIGSPVGSSYISFSVEWPLYTNVVEWSIEHPDFSFDWIFDRTIYNHFEVNASGNTAELFINGISQGSLSFEGSYDNQMIWVGYEEYIPNTEKFYIAGESWLSGDLSAKIDEFRYSVGIRRHTSNFTPMTEPYSLDVSGTIKLLLHMDGENQSPIFVDSSSYNHVVNSNGQVKQTTESYQLGSASGQFTANSDYLSITDDSNWGIFGGSFTIHFWFKFFGAVGDQKIFSQYENSNNYMMCIYNYVEKNIIFEIRINGIQVIYTRVVVNIPLNEFFHIAIVGHYVFSEIRIHINGVVAPAIISIYNIAESLPGIDAPLIIGPVLL